ncbi:5962_t:CDS:2 [Dentiscutata erythropus]|uniref:5962_t:CDS:1 n=1 Tax=Dentiscutata erythropus TaxID=1348616 RepID=A0A9N9GIP1_9GLOM|nr:5962_t:CDS:2 [Dentiscutata erythropus]
MSEYLILLIYGASACYLIYLRIEDSYYRTYLPIFVLCLIFMMLAPLFPIPPNEFVKFKYPYILPFIISLLAIFIIEMLKRLKVIDQLTQLPNDPL